MTRFAVLLVLLAFAPVASAPPVVAQGVGIVNVSGRDLMFEPSNVTVSQGQTIRFTNHGVLPHNLIIEGYNDADASNGIVSGQGADLVINSDIPPGVYTIYCGIPGHRAAGMVGTLTVTAATGVATPDLAATATSLSVQDVPFAAPLGAHPVGEEILIGSATAGYRITVDQARSTPRIDLPYSDPLVARGQFIIVDFTAVMEQLAPTALDFDDFQLFEAATGRTYTVDAQITGRLLSGQYNFSSYDDLQPGLPYNLVLAFEVPLEASQLWLTNSGHQYLVPLALDAAPSTLGTPAA